MRRHLSGSKVHAKGLRAPIMLAALLSGTCATAVADSLPSRYIDLIRHDQFAEAESAAAAETAKIESDPRHKPEALCAALEFQARVVSFDILKPVPARLPVYERALQCREGLADGTDKDAHIAMLKATLATLAFSSGNRERANALAAEAEARIKQHRQLLDAVDYANATLGLGNLASYSADFNRALAWTQESLDAVSDDGIVSRMVRVKVLTTQCYRLGRLGRFAEAEIAGKAAVDLAARMFGVPSTYHGNALMDLGEVEYFGHHLADAAVTVEQAVDDNRRLGERATGNLATSLMVFADVQNDLGDYDRARSALTEAVALYHRDSSPNATGNLASALSNLGMAEAASGHCAAALEPVREALQIYRKRYGEDSAELTGPLSVLGNCELETGQIDKAHADYGQALAISLKTLGEDNPLIAEQYQQVALVDLAEHDYAAATEHLTHALSRLPKDTDTLGNQRIAIERNLARSLHAQHDDAGAFAHATAGESTRQRLLQHFAGALDENEAVGAHETEHSNLDEILALAAARQDHAGIEHAWQLQIGSRAQVTRLVAARLKAARESADPAMRALWEKWKTANAAYASALEGAESGKPGAKLADARDALERAEQALAAQTHALDPSAPVDLAALRRNLPKDAALVGFVLARGDPWGNDYASARHPQHYYAFRLEGAAPVALVDLGDALAIDAAMRDWSAALRDPARSLADVDALGADVARRVWQPLGIGAGMRRVFIVPDGELHRVAWLALPLHDGLLAERGPVPQLLDSERDLFASVPGVAPVQRALLVGAVPPDPALAAAACGRQPLELPGARRELDALRNLWRESTGTQASFLVGGSASKSAVRTSLARTRYVHFATHAFSDDSDCIHSLLAARDVRLSKANKPKTAPALSGLLLATDAHGAPGDRDGLLTPAEVAAYDLDGVDTVTLSACDTGSGTVHADEGVFGLARAFRLAGAHHVVMSLWNVDDAATADLMQRMYRARWVEHAAAADALAAAARATLAARRAAGQSTHPYYWAAFVATGDSR